MANKPKTRCSMSLVIRNMQIRIITKYHLAHTRMAINRKLNHSKDLEQVGRNHTPHTLFVGMEKWYKPLAEITWQFPIKCELSCYPEFPLPGVHPMELKTCPRNNVYSNVHSRGVRNSPKLEIT